MSRFTNKAAIVTGAAGALGTSMVRRFFAEGANVVIGARREEQVTDLVDELGRDKVVFTRLDVSDQQQWAAAVRTAEDTFGPVSVLVNNAALSPWPRFRSERGFYRFADAHLREYFPSLLSHGQLNRRIRAMEPERRELQSALAATLADRSEVYHVLDTTLIPAIVRVRARRRGLFVG